MASWWHWLTTSRYTRLLEAENAELKSKVERLQTVLIPRLSIPKVSAIQHDSGIKADADTHLVTQAKRRSWPVVKAQLETMTNQDFATEIRMQRVEKAHEAMG
jgi:antitoxin component of MazEF toxin-antitoxin module